MPNNLRLELAWEAIQDIYTTSANIYAYRYGLKKFSPFGESTHLIKISRKKTQAYYDANEEEKAAREGLRAFLKVTWRRKFKERAHSAIARAQKYLKGCRKRSQNLSRKELFRRIRVGTAINHALFVAFAACQPQYTALVERHIKSKLPNSLSAPEKDQIFLTLIQSERTTPLVQEELAWERLVYKLVKKFKGRLPRLSAYSYNELEKHATKYGLMVAADGLAPWDKKFLFKKLISQARSNHGSNDVLKDWNAHQKRIKNEKRKIIQKFRISPKVVKLCKEIAELGYVRLCLRVQGWMLITYVLTNELFSQLPQHVPYTTRQIECTRLKELTKIFKGDYSLSKRELDSRYELAFFGLLQRKEVFWHGEQAKRMIKKLIAPIDGSMKVLRGQIGWRGSVRGRAYVFKWNTKNLARDIKKMPWGGILVAGQTRPQLMPAIKKASAIITDEGGVLSHAAIVSREIRKPSVIGTKFATHVLKTGDLVEVDANRGFVRIISRK